MKLKYALTSFVLFLLFITHSQAKHITGGYMHYSVISSNGSFYVVDVNLSVFRDPFGGGASFDASLELGIYRISDNGELTHVKTYRNDPKEILDIESDFLNCRGTLPEYQLGRYKMQIEIPNDGADYQIAYQRCCRSNSILGVEEVENSGMLFTTRVNYESLTSMNTSPSLTDVDNRFFEINQNHNIEMSFIDIEGDEIVISPLTPYEVGGIDGVNFGDPTSCQGITPNPAFCPPLFNTITYASGFSLTEPFGENGNFVDDGNGNYSFYCQSIGMYLLGFKIEEYRNGELLTSSNYETTIITGLREANQAFGQLYLDENENGVYDMGELPFPIAPEMITEYCNYTVDEDHKYNLLLESDVADFKNVANNYTFSNGTNYLSSPNLSLNLSTKFDIGIIGVGSVEEVNLIIYNELSICNEEGILSVELFNVGTIPTKGNIVISKLENMTILSCDCDYQLVGDDIVIQASSLDPLRSGIFNFTVLYADETHVGEAVSADVMYSSSSNEDITAKASFDDIILCSYDPNDIAVTPMRLPNYTIENGEQLIVKIRFENMGNYFASKVAIDQVLDNNLIPSSIKVLDSSHPFTMMTSRNDLDANIKFLFEDIMLSGTNSPVQAQREGYITYAIDIKPDRSIGTSIHSKADIVFDLNQPILTNTVTNVIGILDEESGEPQEEDLEAIEKNLTLYPNPTEDRIFIKNGASFLRYFISNSAQKYLKEGTMTKSISTDNLHPGIYMITFVNKNGYRISKKFVKIEG